MGRKLAWSLTRLSCKIFNSCAITICALKHIYGNWWCVLFYLKMLNSNYANEGEPSVLFCLFFFLSNDQDRIPNNWLWVSICKCEQGWGPLRNIFFLVYKLGRRVLESHPCHIASVGIKWINVGRSTLCILNP